MRYQNSFTPHDPLVMLKLPLPLSLLSPPSCRSRLILERKSAPFIYCLQLCSFVPLFESNSRRKANQFSHKLLVKPPCIRPQIFSYTGARNFFFNSLNVKLIQSSVNLDRSCRTINCNEKRGRAGGRGVGGGNSS